MAYLDPRDEKAHYINNPKLSDVTIHFSGHEVKAHKVILASKSGYFRRMFEGEFLEASVKDVQLHEDDPQAVFGMLAYIYGTLCFGPGPRGAYDYNPADDTGGSDGRGNGGGSVDGSDDDDDENADEIHNIRTERRELNYLLKVYVVADKYGVRELATLAEDTFEERMHVLQDYYTPFEEGRSVGELVSIFEHLATILYHSLGESAVKPRRTLAEAVHRRTLELKGNDRYKRMVKEIPELSVDLLELAIGAMEELQGTKEDTTQEFHSPAKPRWSVSRIGRKSWKLLAK